LYGGGGQRNAGTCQVSNAVADDTLEEIIEKMACKAYLPWEQGKA